MDIISKALTGCFESVLPHLDERQRRLNVGTVAVMLGRGGRTKMSELTGRSRSTVIQGASEIEVKTAFAEAIDGTTILFGEGTFKLTAQLSRID